MTVMEALQWANDDLKQAGIDAPMLDAQVLLAHLLHVPKPWLFTHFADPVTATDEEAFREAVRRRREHEPVAYILGQKEFYRRPFRVSPATLIPRPATETLVEAALQAAHESHPETTLFADIGTGSGAIAITLAAESGLPVMASDVSEAALEIARKNVHLLQQEERVDLRHGDLAQPLMTIFQKLRDRSETFPYQHLILCANLPYLTGDQIDATSPDVRDYEPRRALDGGSDGLALYWKLLRDIGKMRTIFPERLTILLEIDPVQTDRTIALIRHDFPASEPHILQDMQGLNRVVQAEL